MERIAPGRRRLPGGHAEREPARRRRRAARRSSCSTTTPTPGWPRRPSALAAGLREARGRPAGAGRRQTAGPADRLLLRRARRATTRAPPPATPRPTRAWCRGAAGPRRLPAAVAVRGLVPVARAHRPSTSSARSRRPPRPPSRRSHERARRPGRRPCAPRAACSPTRCAAGARRRTATLAPRVAARRGATTTRCWSRRSTRATSSTTATAASLRPPDPDLALLAGDRLYALGLAAPGRARRPRRGRELADVISCARRRTPRATRTSPRPGDAAALAIGRRERRPRSAPQQRATRAPAERP